MLAREWLCACAMMTYLLPTWLPTWLPCCYLLWSDLAENGKFSPPLPLKTPKINEKILFLFPLRDLQRLTKLYGEKILFCWIGWRGARSEVLRTGG